MDYSFIALTKAETRILKKSAKQSVPAEKCKRLLRLKLVYEEEDHVPGYMPVGLGICKISETGIDFLTYRKQLRKDMWFENATIPAVVSIITNLLIYGMQQLWPLIQQWVSNFQ